MSNSKDRQSAIFVEDKEARLVIPKQSFGFWGGHPRILKELPMRLNEETFLECKHSWRPFEHRLYFRKNGQDLFSLKESWFSKQKRFEDSKGKTITQLDDKYKHSQEPSIDFPNTADGALLRLNVAFYTWEKENRGLIKMDTSKGEHVADISNANLPHWDVHIAKGYNQYFIAAIAVMIMWDMVRVRKRGGRRGPGGAPNGGGG